MIQISYRLNSAVTIDITMIFCVILLLLLAIVPNFQRKHLQ